MYAAIQTLTADGLSAKLERPFHDASGLPISVALSDLGQNSLCIGETEVHIWQVTLDEGLVEGLWPTLSEDECARANGFRFVKDRNHFIIARGLLRNILAAYLDVGPGELRFSYADKGKPFLKHPELHSIRFNLAHSHEMAIYAISGSRELGVDLEFVTAELADEMVAERFFSPAEVSALRVVVPELKNQAFFNCWTRKEAYIKARGEGLSMPLNQFEVSLTPDQPAALLKNHTDAAEVSRWSMRSLAVDSGYIGALVVEGYGWTLKTFRIEFSDLKVGPCT